MANKIKCSGCGKNINANAQFCPNCNGEKKESIWGYILGGFFILSGLGALSTGILPALILIAGGALALPITRRALIQRNSSLTHKLMVIVSAILIVFGSLSVTFKKQSERTKYLEENPEAYAADQAERAERAEREAAQQAKKSTSNKQQSGVSSTNDRMNFDACIQKQNSVKNQISSSGNYNIIPIVQTATLSIIRICTNDGSVIITCNAEDGNMITTQSNNKDGC